ncbi:MAG: hypothetical protein IJ544_07880 [Prevotella sp.]|nr:hypothetical protein [Prevotella sp.]
MKTEKTIIRIAGLFLALMTISTMLTACQEDAPSDGSQHELVLMPYAQPYQEAAASLSRATEWMPTGYAAYTIPQGSSLISFIAPQTGTTVAARIFSAGQEEGALWKTNITVDNTSDPYYLYGFMPIGSETSTDIAISQLDGADSYQTGAKLTISKMKALTTQDPCVIVGAKEGTLEGVADFQLGQFAYQFSSEIGQDYVYLLFDHLFGALEFQMQVDATYNELRRIRLKSMQLTALTAKTVKVEVNLRATNDGTSPLSGVSPVTFTVTDGAQSDAVTLYRTASSAEDLLLTTDYRTVGTCYIPTNVKRFKLTAEYDVYDRSGTHLVRRGCRAENVFDLGVTDANMQPGVKHKVKMAVNPTYLYVLSDPDLDNPTITIEH